MEEKLSTKQNKNFFQKNINIVICSIFCTALWGSAFPCVKLGYELFNIGVDDTFSKILFAGWRFFLAGILVLLIATFMQKKFPKLKKGICKRNSPTWVCRNYTRICLLLYRTFICIWI